MMGLFGGGNSKKTTNANTTISTNQVTTLTNSGISARDAVELASVIARNARDQEISALNSNTRIASILAPRSIPPAASGGDIKTGIVYPAIAYLAAGVGVAILLHKGKS